MTERRNHWEGIYQSKKFEACSWYQEIPTHSLEMIDPLPLAKTDSILDVGGGESYLADSLLKKGFSTISVLDIAPTALEKSKKRMGKQAEQIKWIHQDITQFVPKHAFHLWHDRAVFHFCALPKTLVPMGMLWLLRLCREASPLWVPFQKRGPSDAAVSISNNTPLKNLLNVLKLILKFSLQKNFSTLRLQEVNKRLVFVLLKKNNWRRLMKELSFSNNQELLSGLPNASMTYIPNFWSLQEADQIFLVLQEETPWQHDPITVFGKTYMQPV